MRATSETFAFCNGFDLFSKTCVPMFVCGSACVGQRLLSLVSAMTSLPCSTTDGGERHREIYIDILKGRDIETH